MCLGNENTNRRFTSTVSDLVNVGVDVGLCDVALSLARHVDLVAWLPWLLMLLLSLWW